MEIDNLRCVLYKFTSKTLLTKKKRHRFEKKTFSMNLINFLGALQDSSAVHFIRLQSVESKTVFIHPERKLPFLRLLEPYFELSLSAKL